jgi:hypothetical protein
MNRRPSFRLERTDALDFGGTNFTVIANREAITATNESPFRRKHHVAPNVV